MERASPIVIGSALYGSQAGLASGAYQQPDTEDQLERIEGGVDQVKFPEACQLRGHQGPGNKVQTSAQRQQQLVEQQQHNDDGEDCGGNSDHCAVQGSQSKGGSHDGRAEYKLSQPPGAE